MGALIIPGWAQDGGREQMLERFKDPPTRARIVTEAEEAMTARFGGPQGVFLPATRRELVDVMHNMNAGAGETVVRLLETGNQGAILRFGSEIDLIKILQHPTTSIACDCGASLPGRGSHPRNQGTYPRVLGHYVRELKALTWQEAVRKMTLLPAATIGMIDRGAIAPGMAADITVFDPATVIDRASYDEPALPSEGIRYVLVNGVVVLEDGKPTGKHGGRVLRRASYMPSRPSLTLAHGIPPRARRVSARGSVTATGQTSPLDVVIHVTQDRSARSAKGTFRVTDAAGKLVFEARDFGIVQIMGTWAAFTAHSRGSSADPPRAATVSADQDDPLDPQRAPTLRIIVDGLFEATGRLPSDAVQIR